MPTSDTFIENNIVTGRVVDVLTTTKFTTGLSKIASLLVDGEPLQLSRQTTKSTLFVEPCDAYADACEPGSQRALLFLGDIGGQVARTNLIQARVKKGRGGALYVSELNNLTTSSTVKPAVQLSPLALAVAALTALALLVALAWALVGAIADGSILRGLVSIVGVAVGALAPLLVLLIVFRLLIGR